MKDLTCTTLVVAADIHNCKPGFYIIIPSPNILTVIFYMSAAQLALARVEKFVTRNIVGDMAS
jgi:hypothetical protein